MTERISMLWWSAVSAIAVVSIAAMPWGLRAATGVLAGGAWNLASFWCLVQLLEAWLGPRHSRRRAMGWLLVKFPVLYGFLALMFRSAVISLPAFGIGFTVVLIVAIAVFAMTATRLNVVHPDGR